MLFVSAALGSLQLWGAAAGGAQLQEQQQLWRDQIERDRLLVQQHLRDQLSLNAVCPNAEQLRSVAATVSAPVALQRQLSVSPDGAALLLYWPQGQRRRWVTSAGLGLC
ncbi:MAG: hypothetical protein EBZ51_10385 [Synechococcaceae bacterium WB9_2_112]|nr:hypothetical protein [Synechococcaceae bacterium WB9_2_112]